MENSWLIAAAVLTPVAGAVGILLTRGRPNVREAVSLGAAAVLFSIVLALLPGVVAGERADLVAFEVLPGVGLRFTIEPLGIGFALIASLLWFVTVGYAIGYMRAHREEHQSRFYAFFALSIAATIGAAFAGNLLTLYLFYEALTLATYPLVTHGGAAKDRAGGRTYLMVLFGTSLTFLLLALAWTYSLTGSLEFVDGGVFRSGAGLVSGATPAVLAVIYALFLFGTGKAALMPFHRWLPAAMVAPTPVSALLHAVAVVKLGVFVILKVTVYTFGLDVLRDVGATTAMQYVAAATLLVAAVLAIREDNLKRRLAFSTISQLAYIVLAATLANGLAIAAGGMHIAAHAFAKITLFFCAGMILVSLHKTTVTELRGVGRMMPITLTAWVVASLCVIGMPLTGGFWSKWYLAQGTLEAGEPLLLGVVLLGSLLAMGYLLPPAIRAFYAADAESEHLIDARSPALAPAHGAEGAHGAAALRRFEAPWMSLAALTFTAVLSVLLFFAAPRILALLETIAR
jgi:multicomponent Na+:H+ antiporter subunit D